jgi:hypothetical protein
MPYEIKASIPTQHSLHDLAALAPGVPSRAADTSLYIEEFHDDLVSARAALCERIDGLYLADRLNAEERNAEIQEIYAANRASFGNAFAEILAVEDAGLPDFDGLDDAIEDWLVDMRTQLGIDRPDGQDLIAEWMADDILETADPLEWSTEDIARAFRRWMEAAAQALYDQNYTR